MLLREEASWLAALVDGEGTIAIHRLRPSQPGRNPTYVGRIFIYNTNVPLLERAQEVVGFGEIVKANGGKSKFVHGKVTFRWQAHSRQAAKVAQIILPWLIVKRRQCELLLAMQITNQHLGARRRSSDECINREMLWAESKALNTLRAVA